MSALCLPYFRPTRKPQYQYLALPRQLMTSKIFAGLHNLAKLLYSMMLSRVSLSAQREDFTDEQGRLLIELGKDYSQSSTKHVKLLFCQLYKEAIKNQLCDFDPVRTCKIPRYASVKTVNALTAAEQKAFEKATAMLPVVDQFILMTLLLTGLRRDELRCLTWGDWDKKRQVLLIRKSKTANGIREVPVIPEVSAMLYHLEKRGGKKGCQYIFGMENQKLSISHLRHICQKAAELAGIHHVTPHMLRHSFATRMVEAGADPKSLSTIIGHANVAFTLQRYVTVDSDHLAKQMMLLSHVANRPDHR